MTREQMKFILENILGETVSNNVVNYTPLINNFMIVVTKETNLYTDKERWRYKIDLSKGIIEQVQVRRTNTIPIYGEIITNEDSSKEYYEYITDGSGHKLINYFDISKIIMFVPNASKISESDIVSAEVGI